MAEDVWDVAVVGAGPAGARAALAAAREGARVILIDRARALPRYKTCGGGLTGRSLRSLESVGLALPEEPVRQDIITNIAFSLNGSRGRSFHEDRPFLTMVDRAEFDHWLVREAVRAGATLRLGTRVRRVQRDNDVMRLVTSRNDIRVAEDEIAKNGDASDGDARAAGGKDIGSVPDTDGFIVARTVVGADGASGVCAAYDGARYRITDTGLEIEVGLDTVQRQRWGHTVALDWGPLPGSYGWLFPKGDTATVGVIANRESVNGTKQADELRKYLECFREKLGIAHTPILKHSGHLVRIRDARSPLMNDRVVLAGDAAGLAEPWTREGISFAMESGDRAGAAAAHTARAANPAQNEAAFDAYASFIATTLQPEFDAGLHFYSFFARHPNLTHTLLTRVPKARNAFLDVCRGDTTLKKVDEHRLVSAGLAILGKSAQ